MVQPRKTNNCSGREGGRNQKLLGRDHLINAGIAGHSQDAMGKAGKKYTAAFGKALSDGYTASRVHISIPSIAC